MGGATFELFMLIFRLTMTPLMNGGCWDPLFYVSLNLSQSGCSHFVLGVPDQNENKPGQVWAGRFPLPVLLVKTQGQKDLNGLWVLVAVADPDSNLWVLFFFFFSLCVRNLKTGNMFYLKIIQMNGYLKTASGKHSFKIWKPSIMAESLFSIIRHRIIDDFDFSSQLMTQKILISWKVLQHINIIPITR